MKKITIEEKLKSEPKTYHKLILISLLMIIIFVWALTSVDYKGISSNGLKIAESIIEGLMNPDLEFLFDMSDSGVMYLILETTAIALLGTLIGAIIAIPFAFLSASNIVPGKLNYIGISLVTFIRVFPTFVYGLMFIRVAGPGPFAGVLTLSIASIGMMSKLYIESIEELDKGILEALDSAGCTTFQKIRYGIIPQLSTNFISNTIYRFEINIKDASVLGLVGAGGIGAPLIFAIQSYRWNLAGAILIGLIVFVLIVEFCSTRIRKKLATGK